jgi:hypothetical protein
LDPLLSDSILDYIAEYLGYKAYELALILARSCLCHVLWWVDGNKEGLILKEPVWVRRTSLFGIITPHLYCGESAPQHQCYPDEAFAAMHLEPCLPNPEHDRPETEYHPLPKPHDLRITARTGAPISRMAAANRRIPIPGGHLLAISLSI